MAAGRGPRDVAGGPQLAGMGGAPKTRFEGRNANTFGVYHERPEA